MTLKDFILKFLTMEAYIRVYIRDYEDLSIFCDYSGKVRDLLIDVNTYKTYDRLMSLKIVYMEPSFKEKLGMLDIHVANERVVLVEKV